MWNPECASSEADAILADKNGALKSMRIIKAGDDFHVLLYYTWRKEELFLSSTRSQKEPRKFRHIGRLLEHIERTFPSLEKLEIVLTKEKP